ncbi:MAG: hypothetical protein K1Y36_25620 [Blastocatellia bacterium]|nr:hypothetical protein [Blastocatellia bacterium]
MKQSVYLLGTWFVLLLSNMTAVGQQLAEQSTRPSPILRYGMGEIVANAVRAQRSIAVVKVKGHFEDFQRAQKQKISTSVFEFEVEDWLWKDPEKSFEPPYVTDIDNTMFCIKSPAIESWNQLNPQAGDRLIMFFTMNDFRVRNPEIQPPPLQKHLELYWVEKYTNTGQVIFEKIIRFHKIYAYSATELESALRLYYQTKETAYLGYAFTYFKYGGFAQDSYKERVKKISLVFCTIFKNEDLPDYVWPDVIDGVVDVFGEPDSQETQEQVIRSLLIAAASKNQALSKPATLKLLILCRYYNESLFNVWVDEKIKSQVRENYEEIFAREKTGRCQILDKFLHGEKRLEP